MSPPRHCSRRHVRLGSGADALRRIRSCGSKHSRRIKPMSRSTQAFCQGDRNAIGRSRIPMARRRCTKADPYEVSQSRIRYRGAWSHRKASVIWRDIHSVVGNRHYSGETLTAPRTAHWLAGTAVQIAPCSTKFPCKQGICVSIANSSPLWGKKPTIYRLLPPGSLSD